MESDHKPCKTCSVIKPFSEYHRASTAKDGYQNECKDCQRKRLRLWRINNPDKFKAQYPAAAKRSNDYYYANREEVRAKAKARLSTPEEKAKKAAQDKAYREANKEYTLARAKAYAKENAEAKKAYQRANWRRWATAKAATVAWRRATKKQATPAWVDRAALRVVYSEAKRLQQETGLKHHVDHIVPLVSPIVCGLHVPWNLQVLFYKDNHRKSNKHWPDMP